MAASALSRFTCQHWSKQGIAFWFVSQRMLPPLVIALLAGRNIVHGLTLGAINKQSAGPPVAIAATIPSRSWFDGGWTGRG
jgi:hypothetical protein